MDICSVPEWSRRGALASLLALTACASAAPMLVNLVPEPPKPPEPGSGVLEAAFDNAIRMTAPVKLDGQGPFDFVVDTGANVSVASLELADRLALPRIGMVALHGIAGVSEAPLTRVKKLAVGDVSAAIPRMPILAHERLGAEGLLGMDVLRQRRLVMDFRRRKLEITRSSPAEPAQLTRGIERRDREPTFVVPARMRFGQLIIIDAEIAGVKVIAFLDSGSQNTIGNLPLRQAVARKSPTFVENLVRAPLLSATGQVVDAEISAMPPLRLGGLYIGNTMAAFADLHIFELWDLKDRPAILVGADVLRHFNSIEIDYGRRLVTFRPPVESMTLKTP